MSGLGIEMVDLKSQYTRLRHEIDPLIEDCILNSQFIKGGYYRKFQIELANYLKVNRVIGCANGTDALQIAIMALGLNTGDEVIVPAFTYVATAEVVALLGLTPVLVDVDPHTFNIDHNEIEKAITDRTKLIVPVHLFGQCAPMDEILEIAEKYNLYVIEDTAQALGAVYSSKSGQKYWAGTMGHVGCTSFFPSKNLGCYGDGGALMTNDSSLADKLEMIANHGQRVQYVHEVIGVNSRLDNLQAAVLIAKLPHLDEFNQSRNEVADFYDAEFEDISEIVIPNRVSESTHVFHQYTIKVPIGDRDKLRAYLKGFGIPSMVYYPIPLHKQEAFSNLCRVVGNLETTEVLCQSVLSLPIHTEMRIDQMSFIAEKVKNYFNGI